jgi:hypothetical protein
MTRTRRLVLGTAYVVAMGSAVWCAWALPQAGGLALGGAVVVLLAAFVHVAGSRHLTLYLLGAAVMLVALLVGQAEGPGADLSAAGFCVSVFSPEVADAPDTVTDRCQAVRRQHGIIVSVLGAVGAAVMISALRPSRTGHAADAA